MATIDVNITTCTGKFIPTSCPSREDITNYKHLPFVIHRTFIVINGIVNRMKTNSIRLLTIAPKVCLYFLLVCSTIKIKTAVQYCTRLYNSLNSLASCHLATKLSQKRTTLMQSNRQITPSKDLNNVITWCSIPILQYKYIHVYCTLYILPT